MPGNTIRRYPPQLKEPAVRMVAEIMPEHESKWFAMGRRRAPGSEHWRRSALGCGRPKSMPAPGWGRRRRNPSSYYDTVGRRPSSRELRDVDLKPQIRRVHEQNFGVYRARKVWLQLNREGVAVARCTVERLMGGIGLVGARRGTVKRTTMADAEAERARDLASRSPAGRPTTGTQTHPRP